MLAVAVHYLVSNGVLVGKVFVVEEMLPALCLVKVSNLGWLWGRRKENEEYHKLTVV